MLIVKKRQYVIEGKEDGTDALSQRGALFLNVTFTSAIRRGS